MADQSSTPSIEFYSQLEPDGFYRLLELTPELADILESGASLSLKAPETDSHLILCTVSKTYRVRQMNQSNTLLLSDSRDLSFSSESSEAPPYLVAFGSASSYLEVIDEQSPKLSVESIPLYMGNGVISGLHEPNRPTSIHYESLGVLRSRAPLSDAEFNEKWRLQGGVEIDDIACRINDSLTHSIICDILATVIGSKLDLSAVNCIQLLPLLPSDAEPLAVVEAVMARFSQSASSNCKYLVPQFLFYIYCFPLK
ncbi:Dcc1p [Sugiyamaella lignohabitans]|uniref:Dcc1p n=1 Tax=Sugiyamaella lignohabitans TaxID=796027 RepID=A0A167CNV2_9ASCO|nr:Dcc1p [Sugiyamaella lignohabitans]ANB11935.1 Dcc1p [Sugiyamaella lignohabitans]